MNIQTEKTEGLVQSIILELEPSDYQPTVDKELKKIQKEANIKGFRKGKVPKSYVKRTYGKSVKSDAVMKMLNSKLNDYLVEQEIQVILQPLFRTDKGENMDFSATTDESYTFHFDILSHPDMELKGLSDDHSYHKYEVEIPEEEVDEEIENLLKSRGTQEEVEEDVQENDILVLVGKELDEDGKVKSGGWDTSFNIHVGDKMNDEVLKEVLGKDAGESFQADIYELEDEMSEDFVKKHYLNMDADEDIEVNKQFEFIIDEIKRLKPAEWNRDLWDSVFGEDNDIEDEEDARTRIERSIAMQYESYINGYLFEKIQDKLMELNEVSISKDFLERYIKQQSNSETIENMEQEIEGLETYLKWEVIKRQLALRYDIEVSEQELRDQMKSRLMSTIYQNNMQQMLQGMGDDYIDSMVDNLMENQEEKQGLYNSLFYGKVVHAAKDDVNLDIEKVSKEEMQSKIEETQKEMNPPQTQEEE